MKNAFVNLFSVTILTALNLAAAEKDVRNQSFSVNPGGILHMRVDRGSIKILTADSGKVDIQVVRELKRGSDEDAREVYEQHKIEIAQDGNDVRIETENDSGLFGKFRNAFKNLHVEYTVTLPSRFNLDLQTAGGTVEVADLDGTVKLHTSGGDLKMATIKGDINARTTGGNIDLEGGTGNADLQTSGGDIEIGQRDGNLTAKTSGGNVILGGITGDAEISTSGGDISVNSANGTLKARTTGGSIKAQIGDAIKADSSLKTTGGDIDLAMTEKTAVNLNARTTGGNVKSDFEGEYNKQRTMIVAQINGGGPDLTLETTGGDIVVRRK